MIRMVLVGESAVVAHLNALPMSLHTVLLRRVWGLALKLKARVQRKLSGEVLNVVTGALRRSIQADVQDRSAIITGIVYSSGDVKYARIHEFGGQTRAHIIEPRKAAVLAFMMGGGMVFARRVNHPGSKMPERSFLRSSFSEMRDEIRSTLTQGIVEAAVAGRQS